MLVLFLYFATWNRSLKLIFSLIFPMATVRVLALYLCFSYFFKFPVTLYLYFSLYSDGYLPHDVRVTLFYFNFICFQPEQSNSI